MCESDEELPELFRIDYYSNFFIGELINVDENQLFAGFIQYNDNYEVCTANSKRSLLDVAEEMCHMVMTHGVHHNWERTIDILKKPAYLN